MNKTSAFFINVMRSAFSWFLVGAATFVFFFPVLAIFFVLSPFDRSMKQVHPLISLWARTVFTARPLMHVRLEGTHHLKPGATYVLVANHQSLADILAVLHIQHPFKFIAKKELFWIPFLGWSLSLTGYIPLVRGDLKSGKEALEKASDYLKQGVSVLFFPEGTRSPDGEIRDFKIGAFKLAVETGVPVVPIVIDGTHGLLPKGSRLLARRVEVLVKVEAPERPSGGGEDGLVEQFCGGVRSKMIASLSEIRSHLRSEENPVALKKI